MMEENLMLAWKFVAFTTTVCMVFLAWGNINKQKEINFHLKETRDLIKQNNKRLSEILSLRKALKEKGHSYQDLEQKMMEAQKQTKLT